MDRLCASDCRVRCLTAAVVLVLVAGCGDGAAVSSVVTISTIAPGSSTGPPGSTAIPASSSTVAAAPGTPPPPVNIPTTTAAALAGRRVAFTDSGQNLGDERSNHVSLGDLDGDGHLDVVLGDQGSVEIWFSDGHGLFSEQTQEFEIVSGWYVGLDLGDLDGDHDLDARVVVAEGTGRALFNEGGTREGLREPFGMVGSG